MYYVLLDSTGNLIESYGDEAAARRALEKIVEDEPAAAEDVAMLTYGSDGLPVGHVVQVTGPTTPLTLPGFSRA